jgi:hypothetical protein
MRDKILIEVKERVDEMHGVVYRNGLSKAVKDNARGIVEVNKKLDNYVFNREATCPIKIAMEERAKERKGRFDTRLIVYGLIIGIISTLPDLLKIL